ncbi:GNAT family N-acetyltransferase [Nocardioides mangrovicus]|uniref:GNAT family N-acetyltransferase n=1 Tax=Nocardioides mangrovicus TaxID=2478913 RepID=A0A3L8P4N5_9ACTN|nr:GNAT family N-acetyltransferase [Nocardioides mangrovicus]RLV49703.1 GNAT family N-acetyltransferase [Nocardioides mangrovicus]
MQCEFLTDPAEFLRAARPLLEADPVLATVPATIAERRADGLEESPAEDWWLLVRSGGELVGAGMRTAPFGERPAYLLAMPDEAGVVLARELHRRGEDLRAVSGVAGPATACLAECARLNGGRVEVLHHQRLFELGTLREPADVAGSLRLATESDLALASGWYEAFAGDADEQAGRVRGATPHLVRRDDMLRRLRSELVWLWEVDGEPVHLTGVNAPSLGVVRVGPVYTPPAHRGRGYASAAVATTCRRLQAAGNRVCLFTDQANPTSNRIYAALGFEPVTDTVMLQLG